MTREDIIRMGAESKISLYSLGKEKEKFINYLESFAALVASAERSACAKLCDEFNFGQAPMMIQKAIRARKQT